MNHNQLEEKVAELERRLDALCPDGKCLHVDKISARELSLKSPNGKNTVFAAAGDRNSGVWLTRGSSDPSVGMYNDVSQGAAVGVYGHVTPARKRIGFDACLAFDGGGFVQVIDAANKLHRIDGVGKENTFWDGYLSMIS